MKRTFRVFTRTAPCCFSSYLDSLSTSLTSHVLDSSAFHVKHGHYPVLLIDDIFFGIDDKNLAVMIKLLSNSGAQCFLSAPDLYNEKVKEIIGSSHNKLFTLVDMK